MFPIKKISNCRQRKRKKRSNKNVLADASASPTKSNSPYATIWTKSEQLVNLITHFFSRGCFFRRLVIIKKNSSAKTYFHKFAYPKLLKRNERKFQIWINGRPQPQKEKFVLANIYLYIWNSHSSSANFISLQMICDANKGQMKSAVKYTHTHTKTLAKMFR